MPAAVVDIQIGIIHRADPTVSRFRIQLCKFQVPLENPYPLMPHQSG